MQKWKQGIIFYFILSAIIIINSYYKAYITEERKLNVELLYQSQSHESATSFFTVFIQTSEEYKKLLKTLDITTVSTDFDIENFDFLTHTLVISSRHSIDHFIYNLNSKKDSASHLYIAIPIYNQQETNSFFYYSIPSKYTSVNNSKANYEIGVKFEIKK